MTNITGIPRYVYENVIRLDKLIEGTGLDVRIAYRDDGRPIHLPELKKTSGWCRSKSIPYFYNLVVLPAYLRRTHAFYVGLASDMLLTRRSVVVLHDIRPLVMDTDRGFFRFKFWVHCLSTKWFAREVYTVSDDQRHLIADKLGIQYCDVYGLSEIMGPGVAMECAERGGLHIAEDQFYCEIIDPETLEVLPDGEVGELVITTLTRECSPMIRYRTRDVTTINAEPCACGRTHRKIGRLLGRTDDMLIIRGVNVFPSQIEQVITEFPEIATQYQIILTMNGPLDHVELQVETEPDFPIDEVRRLEDLRNRLAAALKSNLQVAVDIKFVEPKTIARSEGKAKRVIDLRGENQ